VLCIHASVYVPMVTATTKTCMAVSSPTESTIMRPGETVMELSLVVPMFH
jgi:hypothetical protein